MSVNINHPNDDISTDTGAQPTLGGIEVGTTGVWVPTVTANTPGDISVAYNIQSGNWIKLGSMYFFELTIDFTPTYTTASGALIVTNAFTASQIARGSVGFYNNITLSGGTVDIGWAALDTAAQFKFSESSSASVSTVLNITAIPSGTNAVLVYQGHFGV